MADSPHRGLRRLLHAAQYSRQGLAAAWRHEAAFRFEVMLAIVLAPLGYALGDSGVERALLIGCLLLVLIIEIINSSIEAAIDRISAERHELSGRAKDLGSAAVFVALLNVVVIWALLVP